MNRGRSRALALLMVTVLLQLTALHVVAGQASAADFSGKWVSATSGKGLIQRDLISTRYFDWEWTITEYGSYAEASGSYTLTQNIPNPSYTGWDPWPAEVGVTYPYYVDEIQIVGDKLVIDMAALEPGQPNSGQIVLSVSGNRMYGSGSYVDAGVTIHYEYDLKRAGIFGFFGGGIIPIASVGFIAVFVAIIVTVTRPVPMNPKLSKFSPQPLTYQPSDVRTTDSSMTVSLPEGGTPVGGVGLTVPPPPPAGRPLPPREHFVRSYEPPRCPVHGDVALVPHYKSAEGDPGSWYCPRCKGYPWGRS